MREKKRGKTTEGAEGGAPEKGKDGRRKRGNDQTSPEKDCTTKRPSPLVKAKESKGKQTNCFASECLYIIKASAFSVESKE